VSEQRFIGHFGEPTRSYRCDCWCLYSADGNLSVSAVTSHFRVHGLRHCKTASDKSVRRSRPKKSTKFQSLLIKIAHWKHISTFSGPKMHTLSKHQLLGCIECMRCRLLLPMIAVSVCPSIWQSVCHECTEWPHTVRPTWKSASLCEVIQCSLCQITFLLTSPTVWDHQSSLVCRPISLTHEHLIIQIVSRRIESSCRCYTLSCKTILTGKILTDVDVSHMFMTTVMSQDCTPVITSHTAYLLNQLPHEVFYLINFITLNTVSNLYIASADWTSGLAIGLWTQLLCNDIRNITVTRVSIPVQHRSLLT